MENKNQKKVLESLNVTKYFHDPVTIKILNDINFSLYESEFVSIIGKSGCGKSTLLYISKEDFYFLVENEPSVNKIYRNILESAYITTQRRIYDFQGTDSLERLRSLIYHQPKILSRISHKIIASYLGITHYTLSRLKAQL